MRPTILRLEDLCWSDKIILSYIDTITRREGEFKKKNQEIADDLGFKLKSMEVRMMALRKSGYVDSTGGSKNREIQIKI